MINTNQQRLIIVTFTSEYTSSFILNKPSKISFPMSIESEISLLQTDKVMRYLS